MQLSAWQAAAGASDDATHCSGASPVLRPCPLQACWTRQLQQACSPRHQKEGSEVASMCSVTSAPFSAMLLILLS